MRPGHTDTQDDYSNPRYACAPRVNHTDILSSVDCVCVVSFCPEMGVCLCVLPVPVRTVSGAPALTRSLRLSTTRDTSSPRKWPRASSMYVCEHKHIYSRMQSKFGERERPN